jgi:predicted transcriptional regulator
MRTVQHILDSKPGITNITTPSTKVIDALRALMAINLSYLVVLESGVYKGVFSERDYSRNVVLKGRSSDSTTVAEVMTTDVPMVYATETVEYCMHLMNSRKTRYLAAYNLEEMVGIITIHDLLRQVIASKEAVFDNTLTNALIDNDEQQGERIY